jgi:uncharacterized DUF497 family protein
MLEFEWDGQKALSNLQKHHVDFQEASTVFADNLSVTFFDPDHSDEEDRYITLGMSLQGRVLMVSHTDRGGRLRIISARKATRKERNIYEEENF